MSTSTFMPTSAFLGGDGLLDDIVLRTARDLVFDGVSQDESSVVIDEEEALPAIETGTDFLAETIAERKVIVEGLIATGLKLMLGASSKAGKTWLLIYLAVAVARGLEWLGLKTHACRVLFLNFEIPRDYFQQRLRAIVDAMDGGGVGTLDLWNLRGHSCPIEELVPTILETVQAKGGYDLIIIDPVYRCYGKRDENSATDMADFLNHLERIAHRTGAAVVYAAHYSKGGQAGKAALDRVAGSGVFARDADAVVTLTDHAEPDHYSVEFVLRNLPALAPFVVRRTHPLFVTTAHDPAKLKRRQTGARPKPAGASAPIGRPPKWTPAQLLDLLPEGGLTYRDWMAAAEERLKCSDGSFKGLLRQLREQHAVENRDCLYYRADGSTAPQTGASPASANQEPPNTCLSPPRHYWRGSGAPRNPLLCPDQATARSPLSVLVGD